MKIVYSKNTLKEFNQLYILPIAAFWNSKEYVGVYFGWFIFLIFIGKKGNSKSK